VRSARKRAIIADKCAMIAMQHMNPDHLRHVQSHPAGAIEPEDARVGTLAAGDPVKSASSFLPLEAGVVSEAIPAFFIGRNREGLWVARNVNRKIGGIFLFESSALSFARRKSRPRGVATIYQPERFELDLKNRGNPFIVHIGRLKRFANSHSQRIIAFIGETVRTLRNWLKDIHVF
jgi:hypothetical protein